MPVSPPKTQSLLLFKAINVGSSNRISMPSLKTLVLAAHSTIVRSHSDIKHYLQSGNLIMCSSSPFPYTYGTIGEQGRYAFVVRLKEEMEALIENLPIELRDRAREDPTKVYCFFLSIALSPAQLDALRALSDSTGPEGDKMYLVGEQVREVLVWYPKGAGRCVLSLKVIEKSLDKSGEEGQVKCWGTGRNWRSVTKCYDLFD